MIRRFIISICPPVLLYFLRKLIGHYDLPFSQRLKKWGHRAYVGGSDSELWYGIGKLQYHFLVSEGLKSHHKFLDLGCGSLRLGQYLIPMLDKGNYCGLDAERDLVEEGIKSEMLFKVVELNQPKFIFDKTFQLKSCPGYDFAIAQSLFTHLTLDDIQKCFHSLSSIANPGSKFFFTFFEGDEKGNNNKRSHPHKIWKYKFETFHEIAAKNGFKSEYIGSWKHPRNQVIAVAIKQT